MTDPTRPPGAEPGYSIPPEVGGPVPTGVPVVVFEEINSDGGMGPNGRIVAYIGDQVVIVARPEVLADLCAHLTCFVTSHYAGQVQS